MKNVLPGRQASGQQGREPRVQAAQARLEEILAERG